MNKISCNTIRDILPLYVDEVVSEDTRTMVVEHLGQCAECRKQYENMKTKVVVPVEDDIKPLKRFKTAWKKKKIILVCLTVLITIVIIFGAISIFNQVQKEALQTAFTLSAYSASVSVVLKGSFTSFIFRCLHRWLLRTSICSEPFVNSIASFSDGM